MSQLQFSLLLQSRRNNYLKARQLTEDISLKRGFSWALQQSFLSGNVHVEVLIHSCVIMANSACPVEKLETEFKKVELLFQEN